MSDPESAKMVYGDLRNRITDFKHIAKDYVVELGGNGGTLTQPLATETNRIISLDINRDILTVNGKILENINPIWGNILCLPFKDNKVDVVYARAVLHHLPDQLDDVLIEIKRVLKKGGVLIIQEPGYNHPIAYVIRKCFPTSSHDPDERPFKPKELIDTTREHFHLCLVEHHYLLSYVMPYIIAKLPFKKATRKLLSLIIKFDKELLKFKIFKPYCGYISIEAR